ncbi:MAG: DUF5106 domain-containing protein [Candidatus Saccharimonadaceae bacterium]
MKSHLLTLTLLVLQLFALVGCNSKNTKQTDKEATITTETLVQSENSNLDFPLPEVPIMITDSEERTLYLSKHYWDLFPFDDTTLISQPDVTEQGLVDYIQLLNHLPFIDAQNSLGIMMNKAKVNPTMYAYFGSQFDKYFYDPNSPFRNEELYIPVVKNLLNSGLLSQIEQERYTFQQEMILKNRVGTQATEFVYTLANGDKKNLHTLKSNYTILYFTNPDCPACAALTKQMDSSAFLHSQFKLNNPNSSLLIVLSIYPDSNLDLWRKALPNMPQENWINAYDNGSQITNKRLYDIKAIPTLYLLDKNKHIILKDTSLEEIEEYFMKVR